MLIITEQLQIQSVTNNIIYLTFNEKFRRKDIVPINRITSEAYEMRSLNHSSRANIKVFSGPRNYARKKDLSFPQDIETSSWARTAFIECVPEIRNSGRAADAKNVWSSTSIHPTCHHGVCSYKLTFKFITIHSIKCLKFVAKKENVYCAVRNKYFPT